MHFIPLTHRPAQIESQRSALNLWHCCCGLWGVSATALAENGCAHSWAALQGEFVACVCVCVCCVSSHMDESEYGGLKFSRAKPKHLCASLHAQAAPCLPFPESRHFSHLPRSLVTASSRRMDGRCTSRDASAHAHCRG